MSGETHSSGREERNRGPGSICNGSIPAASWEGGRSYIRQFACVCVCLSMDLHRVCASVDRTAAAAWAVRETCSAVNGNSETSNTHAMLRPFSPTPGCSPFFPSCDFFALLVAVLPSLLPSSAVLFAFSRPAPGMFAPKSAQNPPIFPTLLGAKRWCNPAMNLYYCNAPAAIRELGDCNGAMAFFEGRRPS